MAVKVGCVQLQAKKCQQTPEAKRKAWTNSSLESSERAWCSRHLDFRHLASGTVVSIHPVMVFVTTALRNWRKCQPQRENCKNVPRRKDSHRKSDWCQTSHQQYWMLEVSRTMALKTRWTKILNLGVYAHLN